MVRSKRCWRLASREPVESFFNYKVAEAAERMLVASTSFTKV
jgi:hypothetical protein